METVIEKYNNLQKQILNDFAIKWNRISKTNFKDDFVNYYGFEKRFGWNILLNAITIIEDTELAKKSFAKFELQGPSRHNDVGERYLRLYGILNAIYQQKLAVENLLEIFKVSNKKEFVKKLAETNLIIIRNKIGAHSTNFVSNTPNPEHKFDVYEINRDELLRDKILLSRNQKNIENYNLKKELEEFDKLVEEILYTITGKILKKIYNNQGEYFRAYEEVNEIKNGAIILGGLPVKLIIK